MFKSILFGDLCIGCRSYSKRITCSNCAKQIVSLKWSENGDKGDLIGFKYEGIVKKLIIIGKYSFNKQVWSIWRSWICRLLSYREFKDKKILITYPPMTWMRFCFRGFNQSKLLADMIGRFMETNGCKVKVDKVCKRVNFEKSASLMSRSDRFEALKNCFVKIKDVSNYDVIVLVDDVLTTGATLQAMEDCLDFEGEVVRVCLASGRKFGNL